MHAISTAAGAAAAAAAFHSAPFTPERPAQLIAFAKKAELSRAIAMAEAPSALILGGCGFVGRNLVQHLVEKKLCSKIKVVDRTMPAMAFLSESS